jgi:Ca2+-binding EF-hand superfamily protein
VSIDLRERLRDLKTAFARFDRDGNGRIDYQEFRELLDRVGPSPTEEEAQLAFTIIDDSGTGYVSFDEFVSWWLDR